MTGTRAGAGRKAALPSLQRLPILCDPPFFSCFAEPCRVDAAPAASHAASPPSARNGTARVWAQGAGHGEEAPGMLRASMRHACAQRMQRSPKTSMAHKTAPTAGGKA